MYQTAPIRNRVQNAASTEARVRSFGQYPTPMWAAEAIVERYFPDLDRDDAVIEPSCGPGRFLEALPADVPATGVEIDPAMAAVARERTGRQVIEGDFATVSLDIQPTKIIGNPPFDSKVIDRFLDRSYRMLPEGGRLGFILPAYMIQTASRVETYNTRWSIEQEAIPRNLFPGLKLPLVFAVFSKDMQRTLIGFGLYRELAAIQRCKKDYRRLMDEGRSPVWRTVVQAAIEELGGEADLQDIYQEIEGRLPTENAAWKEKIRQTVQRGGFVRTGRGRYALPEMAETGPGDCIAKEATA